MEVRDPIHGSIELTESEVELIDCPLFQRLRNIKQMGFADLAFPGATHSRYLHSIGALFLAGRALESIFRRHDFQRPGLRDEFRQLVRLAALLHDIGHAPLSHCTEFAMPDIGTLNIPGYPHPGDPLSRRATHEDYTIKILLDSPIGEKLRWTFTDTTPQHVAALVNQALPMEDDYFFDRGINFRPVLSQIISSELDVDRMDYLRRDSYYAGVSYGNFDFDWISSHLTFHVSEAGAAHLAIDPRAIYTFNDFLISRYHMFLMVYFHHKSVIYEEMLKRYFQSPESTYQIPADPESYVHVDDYQLYHHLRIAATAGHAWAERIALRDPYRLLIEHHGKPEEIALQLPMERLRDAGIGYIEATSRGDLSKYTKPGEKRRRATPIYVQDKDSGAGMTRSSSARLLEDCTDLFIHYEAQRQIGRLYVAKESMGEARALLSDLRNEGARVYLSAR